MEQKAKTALIAGIIAAIVIPSGIISILLLLNTTADNAQVSIKSIELTDLSDNSMTVNVDFDVVVETDLRVTFKLTNVIVNYKGSQLGTATLAPSEFTANSQNYQTVATITIMNQALYKTLVNDFVQQTTISLNIAATVGFTGDWAALPDTAISKDVTLNGMDITNNPPTIQSFTLLNISDEEVEVEIQVGMNNPSSLSATIETLTADVSNTTEKIGDATGTDVNFISGANVLTLTAKLNTTHNNITAEYLQDDTINFTVEVYIQLNAAGDLLLVYNETITVDALGGFAPEFNAFRIISADSSGLTFEIDTAFNNTSQLETNITSLLVNITYSGQVIGNATLNDVEILGGVVNNLSFTAALDGSGNNLIQDFLNSYSLNFTLDCYMNFSGGEYAFVFQKNVSVAAFEGLSPTMEGFTLVGVTGNFLEAYVNTTFTNPTQLYANFSQIIANVTHNGNLVGNATQNNVNLVPGVNSVDFLSNIDIVGTNFIDAFIDNKTLELNVTVYMRLDSGGDLIRIFSKNVTIDGMDGLNMTVNSITLIEGKTDELIFEIDASIENPSQLAANLSRVWIDIFFEGGLVGNASLTNYTLVQDTNQIKVNATLGGNRTALSKIVERYIEGEDSILTLEINATIKFEEGGTEYSHNYTKQYTYVGSTTELFTIGDIDISVGITFTWGFPGSITGASIDVDITITLHNPMDFAITVDAYTSDVFLNDTEGAASMCVPGFPTVCSPAYGANENFELQHNATLNAPVALPGGGSNDGNADMPLINDLETGIRLYDEYNDNGYIDLDLRDGILDVYIGAFFLKIGNLDFYDVRVDGSDISITF